LANPLVPCPDCGNRVSPDAAHCPKCGAPIKGSKKAAEAAEQERRKVQTRRIIGFAIIGAIILVAVIGNMDTDSPQVAAPSVTAPVSDPIDIAKLRIEVKELISAGKLDEASAAARRLPASDSARFFKQISDRRITAGLTQAMNALEAGDLQSAWNLIETEVLSHDLSGNSTEVEDRLLFFASKVPAEETGINYKIYKALESIDDKNPTYCQKRERYEARLAEAKKVAEEQRKAAEAKRLATRHGT
jgi:predicted nucleic acid-binding Zn ribbon protein